MEVRDLFAEKKDKNGGVVVKSVSLYLVKRLAKVFIGSQVFPELEHISFDANAVFVMHGLELESTHVAKIVEIY